MSLFVRRSGVSKINRREKCESDDTQESVVDITASTPEDPVGSSGASDAAKCLVSSLVPSLTEGDCAIRSIKKTKASRLMSASSKSYSKNDSSSTNEMNFDNLATYYNSLENLELTLECNTNKNDTPKTNPPINAYRASEGVQSAVLDSTPELKSSNADNNVASWNNLLDFPIMVDNEETYKFGPSGKNFEKSSENGIFPADEFEKKTLQLGMQARIQRERARAVSSGEYIPFDDCPDKIDVNDIHKEFHDKNLVIETMDGDFVNRDTEKWELGQIAKGSCKKVKKLMLDSANQQSRDEDEMVSYGPNGPYEHHFDFCQKNDSVKSRAAAADSRLRLVPSISCSISEVDKELCAIRNRIEARQAKVSTNQQERESAIIEKADIGDRIERLTEKKMELESKYEPVNQFALYVEDMFQLFEEKNPLIKEVYEKVVEIDLKRSKHSWNRFANSIKDELHELAGVTTTLEEETDEFGRNKKYNTLVGRKSRIESSRVIREKQKVHLKSICDRGLSQYIDQFGNGRQFEGTANTSFSDVSIYDNLRLEIGFNTSDESDDDDSFDNFRLKRETIQKQGCSIFGDVESDYTKPHLIIDNFLSFERLIQKDNQEFADFNSLEGLVFSLISFAKYDLIWWNPLRLGDPTPTSFSFLSFLKREKSEMGLPFEGYSEAFSSECTLQNFVWYKAVIEVQKNNNLSNTEGFDVVIEIVRGVVFPHVSNLIQIWNPFCRRHTFVMSKIMEEMLLFQNSRSEGALNILKDQIISKLTSSIKDAVPVTPKNTMRLLNQPRNLTAELYERLLWRCVKFTESVFLFVNILPIKTLVTIVSQRVISEKMALLLQRRSDDRSNIISAILDAVPLAATSDPEASNVLADSLPVLLRVIIQCAGGKQSALSLRIQRLMSFH